MRNRVSILIAGLSSIIIMCSVYAWAKGVLSDRLNTEKLLYSSVYADNGDYDTTAELLGELQDSDTGRELLQKAKYNAAVKSYNDNHYDEAEELFEELGDYEDSLNYISKIKNKSSAEISDAMIYNAACLKFNEADYSTALKLFESILYYKDSRLLSEACARLAKEW